MKYAMMLLCLLFVVPIYAGKTKPETCGGNNPPPNPVTPTVKKHKSDDGISFAEGAAIVIGIGLVCNLTEGCKAKVGQ